MRTYTFRSLLAVVLGAFACLPILLIAGGFHFYLEGQLEKQITEKNQILAKIVAGQIQSVLHRPLSLLRSIDALREIHPLEQFGNSRRAELNALVAGQEGIESVMVLDRDGTLVDSGFNRSIAIRKRDLIGLSMEGKQYFHEAVGKTEPYWSDVFSTILTGRPSLAVSLPTDYGVLVGIFNVDWLDEIIQQIGETVGVEVIVTDRKGVMILSRMHDRDRQRINLSSFETVRRGLAGEEGTFLYVEDQQRRLGSVAHVPETGWLVIVSQSYESAFAPLSQLRFYGIGGLCLVLFAAATAALYLAGQITKPLSMLARQARLIARGDLEHEVQQSSYAEINALAADFGHMAGEVKKRESELRDNEERFRTVIDGSSAAVALKELDGRYILVNEEFAKRLGLSPDEIIGRYSDDTKSLEFSERSQWSDREVMRTGKPIEYEYWDNDEKGSVRFYLVNKFPVRDAGGSLCAIGVVSADVTDLKRAETELRNIAERVSGTVGVDFFRIFVRQISETLDMDAALICRQASGRPNWMETVAIWADGQEAPPITYDLAGTPCEDVFSGGLCVFQSGIRDLFPKDGILADLEAEGFLGTPLLGSDGQTVGLIAVVSRKRILNPNKIVPILKIFAARAGAELERLAMEESLRQSESHYRKLFDGLVSGCAVHEIICDENGEPVDYRFLDVNPAFERITGLQKADIVGRRVREVLPNIEEVWIETYGRVALKGETMEFEQYNADLGKHFHVSTFSPQLNLFAISVHDVSERHRAEAALRDSERDLRGMFDNMVDAFVRWRIDGTILMASPAFARIFGIPVESAIGMNFTEILDVGSGMEMLNAAADASGRIEGFEIAATTADGKPIWLSMTAQRLSDEFGDVLGFEGIARDITSRKATEDALRRSQRLESIGQLTGGIAHDFNNMLGVIIGNLDFLLEIAELEGPLEKRVSDALHAAWRGADLTKRLLAFSRREAANPDLNDVNRLLDGMKGMLSRVITEQIELTTELGDGVWDAGFDAGDFEDAVLNLVINARDAMPSGGRLEIRTEKTVIRQEQAAELDCAPGHYVKVSITDTGSGMSQEVLDHVLEPFFTTKSEGSGTGLGLSMVYGFIQRSRGAIQIDSMPGQGTTVAFFLPRGKRSRHKKVESEKASQVPRGTETILVVDDAIAMRELAAEYLVLQGYHVLQAVDGRQALEILRREKNIDFLFSDIVMPGGLNGEELAVKGCDLVPGLRVLLTTGFTKGMVASGQATDTEFEILPKPYRLDELARRIRQIMDV